MLSLAPLMAIVEAHNEFNSRVLLKCVHNPQSLSRFVSLISVWKQMDFYEWISEICALFRLLMLSLSHTFILWMKHHHADVYQKRIKKWLSLVSTLFTSTSVWWWNYQQLSILSIIYVIMRIHDEWTIKIGCFSLMLIIQPFRRWFADVVSGSSVFFSFPLPTIWFNTQHTISNYYEWSLWNDDDTRLGTERDRESISERSNECCWAV
jgi:hypothetical protein